MRLRTIVARIENQWQGPPRVTCNSTHDCTTARARRATFGKVLLWRKRSIGDSGGPFGPILWLAVLALTLGYIAHTVGFDGASESVGLRLRGVDQAIGEGGAPVDGPLVMIHRGREDESFEADVQGFRLVRERRYHVSREAALGGETREGAHVAHEHGEARLEAG